MRLLSWLVPVGLLSLIGGCNPAPPAAATPPLTATRPTERAALEVTGKTEPAPGRRAIIAPVVLHPVVEVKVAPGDRVKKDQLLVKLDDDEPRADVRAKKAALAELQASVARLKAQPREEERAEARAALDSARVTLREWREAVKRLDALMLDGQTSEAVYRSAQANLLRYEKDVLAAESRLQKLLKQPVALEIAEAEARVATAHASLESSQAELEHYTLTAPIDGVVSWLDVHVGTVSRPGTSVWGEILDLSELDVRCELTPEQADRAGVGQAAEVRRAGARPEPYLAGRVVSVGVAADAQTGRVPVRVRVDNPGQRLRCGAPVTVRFLTAEAGPAKP
jgi:multidrug resistance efflux pump